MISEHENDIWAADTETEIIEETPDGLKMVFFAR
jgi:hypothetical protein